MSCAYNGKSEISPLKTQRNLFLKSPQCVPRSKHSPPRLQETSFLMQYKVKAVPFSE